METDKKRTGVVYALSHKGTPDRVRYVGRTIQAPSKRMQEHWRDARNPKHQNPINRWLRKNLETPGNVIMTVISTHDVPDVNQAEVEAIAEYQSSGQADLNLVSGGQGALGGRWSDEMRARRREFVPRGDAHVHAKLTTAAVKAIRQRCQKEWVSSVQIAKEWGMSVSTVTEMLRNETWVDPEYDPGTLKRKSMKGVGAPNSRLTWGTVAEIRGRAQRELKSTRAWAREYGISQTNVRDILANTIWVDSDFDPTMIQKFPRNGDKKCT